MIPSPPAITVITFGFLGNFPNAITRMAPTEISSTMIAPNPASSLDRIVPNDSEIISPAAPEGWAIIGADGFSIKYGLTNSTQAESWINRLMITNTHGSVILVADSSKLGRVAHFKTVPLSAVSIIVTDTGIDRWPAPPRKKRVRK